MLLVTGITGQIGAALAPFLAQMDHPLRVLVRDPERLPAVLAGRAEVVVGDLADSGAVCAAFTGMRRAFLLTKPGPGQLALEKPFIEAAAAAGLERLVRLSVYDARPDAVSSLNRTHSACEDQARVSGLAVTVLRPHFFMENLVRLGSRIAAKGTFSFPIGATKIAPIAVRDVAAAIAAALTRPDVDPLYRLTGPASLSFAEIAADISAVIGRDVTYQAVAREAFVAGLERAGFARAQAEGLAGIYADFADTPPTGDFTRLTGKPATPLAEVIAANRTAFVPRA